MNNYSFAFASIFRNKVTATMKKISAHLRIVSNINFEMGQFIECEGYCKKDYGNMYLNVKIYIFGFIY